MSITAPDQSVTTTSSGWQRVFPQMLCDCEGPMTPYSMQILERGPDVGSVKVVYLCDDKACKNEWPVTVVVQ